MSEVISEPSLVTLLHTMDDGFCVLELIYDEQRRPVNYRFLQANPAFEQQTGLVACVGRTLLEFIPSGDGWPEIYGKVVATGKAARFTHFSPTLDRWFDVNAFPFGNPADFQVAVLFRDVTQLKHEQLRSEFLMGLSRNLASADTEGEIVEITTRSVGNHLNVGRCYFVECLEEQNLIIASPNWVRDRGASVEGSYNLFDFGGMEWWRRYSGGDFGVEDTETHPLTSAKAANYASIGIRAYAVQPFRREGKWTAVLAVTENRPRRWSKADLRLMDDVMARVWPLIERARSQAALRQGESRSRELAEELKVAHGRLAEKAGQLEALVQQRTLKLQETIGELEAFSYSIAHDMRAPLRSLQGFSETLLSEYAEKLDADGQFFLRRIAAAAMRMDRLILDVLNYSRVVRADLSLETVELVPLLQGILETYPQFGRDQADIALEGPFPPVKGNEAMLTQIFSNLLGNAVKFVRPDTRAVVRISAAARGNKVRIAVRDQGIGIPGDQLHQIFGIFHQVGTGYGGTGIGLAIVNKAAERMGGSVGVLSQLGEGSTFWVELQAG